MSRDVAVAALEIVAPAVALAVFQRRGMGPVTGAATFGGLFLVGGAALGWYGGGVVGPKEGGLDGLLVVGTAMGLAGAFSGLWLGGMFWLLARAYRRHADRLPRWLHVAVADGWTFFPPRDRERARQELARWRDQPLEP